MQIVFVPIPYKVDELEDILLKETGYMLSKQGFVLEETIKFRKHWYSHPIYFQKWKK